MRLPKIDGLLAAALLLVGSACGSQPSEQELKAALAAAPAPRELTPAPPVTTTTTAPPTTTTTAAPRPVQRPARVRSVPRPTVPPAPVVAPSTEYDPACLTGWRHIPADIPRAHACWDGLLASYAWNTTTAFRIMWCESKGDPRNVGPPTRFGTAKGLMQVLPDGSFDPVVNMQQAWAKFSRSGWRPWVCQ